MGGDVRNVSPCVGRWWMDHHVSPGNVGQPFIPIRKDPTPKLELALNVDPLPPRLGIVPTHCGMQHRQRGVPLGHAHRAQP